MKLFIKQTNSCVEINIIIEKKVKKNIDNKSLTNSMITYRQKSCTDYTSNKIEAHFVPFRR